RIAGRADTYARAAAFGSPFDGNIARLASNRMAAGLHDDARTLVIGTAAAGAPQGDIARRRFNQVDRAVGQTDAAGRARAALSADRDIAGAGAQRRITESHSVGHTRIRSDRIATGGIAATAGD